MQFHHHWTCLFIGKTILQRQPTTKGTRPVSDWLSWVDVLIWQRQNKWFAYVFLVFPLQGWSSHTKKCSHTFGVLSGKTTDIPCRSLEAFLPKNFWSGPSSGHVVHHGKSNRANCVKYFVFLSNGICKFALTSKFLNRLSEPHHQKEQPNLVKCSGSFGRGESQQVQSGRTTESGFHRQLVPE